MTTIGWDGSRTGAEVGHLGAAPEAPTRVRSRKGQVNSYGDGRVCGWRGCATQLSRYNKTVLCSVHDRPDELSK